MNKMRYIRTENGIYETFECLKDGGFACLDNYGKVKYISSFDIIKQANEIEELCDEFVIKNQHNTYYTMNYEDMMSDYHWGRFHERDVIYGAIWTSKGLMYVAKMNEKGELELI